MEANGRRERDKMSGKKKIESGKPKSFTSYDICVEKEEEKKKKMESWVM
jgi:hypothetical protein